MKIDLKVLGGILLIIGTSLGGGMLALPVSIAHIGFPVSCIYMIIIWSVMTFAALLILEVNLALPPRSNMISMAYMTLGNAGRVVSWFIYLFLLYILLAAYLSGGSDVIASLLELISINLYHWQSVLFFLLVMGTVIVSGITAVEQVNSGLMSAKFIIYGLLIIFMAPHIHFTHLNWDKAQFELKPISVLITSFGYAIVIPSLRSALGDDVKRLRWMIIVGSLIPLACYILWNAAIMGVIPRFGSHGLLRIQHADHTTIELTESLSTYLKNSWVTSLFRSFTALSMLTTFLGVGISLTDFLADGLKIEKRGNQGVAVYALTFLPPLIIVLFRPDAFLYAIQYAGIFVVALLIGLPVAMAYSARFVTKLKTPYRVSGGKLSLLFSGVIAVVLLIITMIYRL